MKYKSGLSLIETMVVALLMAVISIALGSLLLISMTSSRRARDLATVRNAVDNISGEITKLVRNAFKMSCNNVDKSLNLSIRDKNKIVDYKIKYQTNVNANLGGIELYLDGVLQSTLKAGDGVPMTNTLFNCITDADGEVRSVEFSITVTPTQDGDPFTLSHMASMRSTK